MIGINLFYVCNVDLIMWCKLIDKRILFPGEHFFMPSKLFGTFCFTDGFQNLRVGRGSVFLKNKLLALFYKFSLKFPV
jgi:hypothetical protein